MIECIILFFNVCVCTYNTSKSFGRRYTLSHVYIYNFSARGEINDSGAERVNALRIAPIRLGARSPPVL